MSDRAVKTYCINFGVLGVNVPAFTQYLYDSADIIAFWNYIPLVYCIKSRLLASELAPKVRHFFPNGGYMIAEINSNNADGWLPADAWDWFYLEHHHKGHRPPPLAGFAPPALPPTKK